jgi:CRISPR/Cas system-associated exonuclease Cas4 (RecB family)
MQEFLYELASKIDTQHKSFEQVTIVFPNRRAILYFRKHLTALLKRPAFAPELLTIEEFIAKFSASKVPDKLELIQRLHTIYESEMGSQSSRQSFSDFFFWGEMLLRDFEEIDKYRVEAVQLFTDLSNQKEIDTIFEFLSEEQLTFLKEFWGNFDEHPSKNKTYFLRVWRVLASVYNQFKQSLTDDGLAYLGMVHREVADGLGKSEATTAEKTYSNQSIYFAGFNALTLAEEKIITYFVEKYHASIVWDTDAYYVNNNAQEAGTFFREYQKHTVLGKTFNDQVPAHFQEKISNQTSVQVIGASQPMGQVKALAKIIDELLLGGAKPEETIIVLPDEKMLLPVLHSIPQSVSKLNVTMGFPLVQSPMFNFIELLFELQLTTHAEGLHHRPVFALLQHSYAIALMGDQAHAIRKHIVKQNWVQIPTTYFTTLSAFYQLVFTEVPRTNLIEYLSKCVDTIGNSSSIDALDKEYAFYFYKFLNRLQDISDTGLVAETENRKKEIRSFQRLFQQLARTEKIPFAGEPLEGLQIMGVLETRNLDYKNVFILSLNEGSLPSGSSKGSYIPYNLRKAYGLPTAVHQDAMYAYLFYRMLQRAENIHLFYSTETDTLGQGEMSRYLQQLLYESGLNINKRVVHTAIQPKSIEPIVIKKNTATLDVLAALSKGRGAHRGISPSALSMYVECRLKFYFKYVAGIKEAAEVEEDLDNRVLGDFLHKVIEQFYRTIQARTKSAVVKDTDLQNYTVDLPPIIDSVFREAYGLDRKKEIIYKGQRLVVREMVLRFAQRIVELDKQYAPFELVGLERAGLTYDITIENAPFTVTIGGIIDRVDRKDNILRIVDYKTGRDELSFNNIESLFERGARRNKAAFQTLVYALLYKHEVNDTKALQLKPGLINRKNLFDASFEFGLRMNKQIVDNALPLLPAFEEQLKVMLEELHNPETVFDQTVELETCKYCEFKSICYR